MDSFDGPTTRLDTWGEIMEWIHLLFHVFIPSDSPQWNHGFHYMAKFTPKWFLIFKFCKKDTWENVQTYSNLVGGWMVHLPKSNISPTKRTPSYLAQITIFQQPRNLPEVFWGFTGLPKPNFSSTFRGAEKKNRVLCWLEGKGKIPNPPLCDHNSRIQGLWLLPQWKIQCVFWVAKKWGGFVSDPGTLNTCVFLLSKWWEWTLQLSLYSTRTYEMFGKCSHFLESTLYSIPV